MTKQEYKGFTIMPTAEFSLAWRFTHPLFDGSSGWCGELSATAASLSVAKEHIDELHVKYPQLEVFHGPSES